MNTPQSLLCLLGVCLLIFPSITTAQESTDRKLKAVHEGAEEEDAMTPEMSALLDSYSDENFPKQFDALYHPNPNVRIKAMKRLIGDAEEHPELVERVAKLTYDPNEKVRDALFESISYQFEHYKSDAMLQPMIDALLDENANVAGNAAQLLAEYGPDAHAAVPRLIDLLDNKKIGYWAATALGAIGEKAKPAIPKLVEHLEDDSSFAHAVGRLGAKKELIASLDKVDSYYQGFIAEGLALINPTDDEIVEALGKHLKSSGVVHALGDLRPANEKIVGYLAEALKSENEYTRQCAADALGKMEPKFPSALPLLNAALKDEDADVRTATAKALKGYELGPVQKLTLQLSVAGDKGMLNEYAIFDLAMESEDYDVVKKIVTDPESETLVRLNGLVLLNSLWAKSDDEEVRKARETEFKSIASGFLEADDSEADLKALSAFILSRASDYRDDYSHVTPEMIEALRIGFRDGKRISIRERCCKALGWLKVTDAIGDLLDAVDAVEFFPEIYQAIINIDSEKAVPGLIRKVRGHIQREDRDRYVEAARAVGEIGKGAQELIPVLRPLLTGDPKDWYSFRPSTAQTISKILVANELETEPFVKQFAQMISNDESDIADAGFEGLKLMPDKALASATEAIADQLRSKLDHYSADGWVELLGRTGESGRVHAELVLQFLKQLDGKDDRKYKAIYGLTALVKLKVPKIYLPLMEKEFTREDGLPGSVMSALMEAGPEKIESIPYLTAALKNTPDEDVRERICTFFGSMGPAGEKAIPSLVDSMSNDPEYQVRFSAKDALIRIGYENETALAALFSSYSEGEEIGLFRYRPEENKLDPQIVKLILDKALESDDPGISSGAIRELTSADDPKQYEDVFLTALKSDNSQLQSAAVNALQRIGGYDQELKFVYIGLLNSDDVNVREDAFYRLQYAEPAIRRELVQTFTDPKRPIELRRSVGRVLLENERLPFSVTSQLNAILEEDDQELKLWAAIILKRENALENHDILKEIPSSDDTRLKQALASQLSVDDRDPEKVRELSEQLLMELFTSEDSDVAEQAAYQFSRISDNEKLISQCKSWLKDPNKTRRVFNLLQNSSEPTPMVLLDNLLAIAKDSENEHAEAAFYAIWQSENSAVLLMKIAANETLDVNTRRHSLNMIAQGRPYLGEDLQTDEPWIQLEQLRTLASLLDSDEKEIAQFAAIAAANNDKFNSKVGKLMVETITPETDWRARSLLGQAWNKVGDRGSKIVPLLIELTKSANSEQLSQIAEAFSQIAPKDNDAIEAVVSAFGKLSEDERYDVEYALSNWGKPVVDPLMKLMNDQPELAMPVMRVLPSMYDDNAISAVPALRKLMNGEASEVAIKAATMLASLDPETEGIVETLVTYFDEPDMFEDTSSYEVFNALAKLGARAEPAAPALINLLDGDDAGQAIVTLGEIKAKEAKPRLVELLESDFSLEAAVALVRIGDVKEATVEKIANLAGKTDRTYELMEATKGLKPEEAEPIIKKFEEQLDDEYMALQAIWNLRELGTIAAPAANSLVKLIDSPDPRIRSASISAIAQIATPEFPIAVERLMSILQKTEDELWIEAARALGAMQHPEALPILIAELDNEDRFHTAAQAIAGYKSAGAPAVEKLKAAFAEEKKRETAMYALYNIGEPAKSAIPLIHNLLNVEDSDDDAQFSVVHALGEFGPLAIAAVPDLEQLLKADDGSTVEYVATAIWNINPDRAEELGLKQPRAYEE